MAHTTIRINLSSVIFPFASDLWGRSVIVPQYDQNFDRSLVSSAETEKDRGIPQAFYMHNVMPTEQGYQAIGYETKIVGLAGATDFDAAFTLQSPNDARSIFVPAAGKNYIYDATVGVWTSVSALGAGVVPNNVMVTTAFIQGETYIYFANNGCYKYGNTDSPKDLIPVILAGLDPTQVLGITAANGYMIAWTVNSIAWSNATVPTDFTPSLITGAGGGGVNDVKGNINFVMSITGGIMIYCERNVVGGTYTGNARFPYVFVEVPGSAGVNSPEQVSWQSNLSEHYVWSTAGLQVLSRSGAKNIYPEATDFLSAKIFEDFDETTLTLKQSFLGSQLNIKVGIVGTRYAVISYGVSAPDYTHALVYDITLKRWGKLRITHRDCFEWPEPNLYGSLTYGQLANFTYGQLANVTYGQLNTVLNIEPLVRKQIAFLQADGTVQTVNFDLSEAAADGVLLLGKFQFMRNKRIIHQHTDVETVLNSNAFNFYIVPTQDGKTLDTPVPGFIGWIKKATRRYLKRLDCFNYSLLCVGAFHMVSIETDFTQGGDR